MSGYIDNRGRIDFDGLKSAAEAAEAEREQKSKETWEADRQRAIKKAKELDDLLSKMSEKVTADNAKAAEAAIKEETDKAAQAIKDKYNALHNVKEETAIEQGYKNLLGAFKKA